MIWPLQYLHATFTKPGTKVLGLGDSVMARIAKDEKDKPLAELLFDRIPDFMGLAASAVNPVYYRLLLQCLGKMPYKPDIIILPVNMRCFSPDWDLKPAYALKRERDLMASFLAHPTTPIPSSSGPAEVDESQYKQFLLLPTGLEDYPIMLDFYEEVAVARDKSTKPGRPRAYFAVNYTTPLSPDNRQLVALNDCLRLMSASGIKSVCYVTPLNYEAGVRFLNGRFMEALERNIAVLPPMTNWSTLFPSSEFFTPDDWTEHLRLPAREHLADLIAEKVNSIVRV